MKHGKDPAEATSEMNTADHDRLTMRKHLKKQAERDYPGKKIAWINGILCFMDGTNTQPIPNVQCMPKPQEPKPVIEQRSEPASGWSRRSFSQSVEYAHPYRWQ